MEFSHTHTSTQQLLIHTFIQLFFHSTHFLCMHMHTCVMVTHFPPLDLPHLQIHFTGDTSKGDGVILTLLLSISHHGSSWRQKIPQQKNHSTRHYKPSPFPLFNALFQFSDFKTRWWTWCKQRPAKLWSIVFDNEVTSLFSLSGLTLDLPTTVL